VRFFSEGWLSRAFAAYVTVVRNTPLLVQIYFIFFGLPSAGITLSAFVTGIVALTFNSSAYVSEIVRGALLSLPRGQIEAARALSLRPTTTLRMVLLPQSAAIAVPALCGQLVQLIKDTSLLYVISVYEIFKSADDVANQTYSFLESYLVAGVLYLILGVFLNLVVDAIERRLRYVR
jgi:ABC-type amino acid transport system permease subunit